MLSDITNFIRALLALNRRATTIKRPQPARTSKKERLCPAEIEGSFDFAGVKKAHLKRVHAAGGAQIWPNFGGLVLGCIEAKFCKYIFVLQHFQALQVLPALAPLQTQNLSRSSFTNHIGTCCQILKIQEDNFIDIKYAAK